MPSVPQSRVVEHHSPDLSVAVDLVRGRITLHGELDRENVHHLLDAVESVRDARQVRWELDASGVTFCDAGGLRGLLAAQVAAARTGRTLSLVRPSRCVGRLVTLVGLDDLVRAAVGRDAARPVRTRVPDAVVPLARRGTEPAPPRASGSSRAAG